MNIKYSKQKQEMREDPVLNFFFKAKAWSVKNLNTLIGTVIVLVFLLGGVLVYWQMHSSGVEKAGDAFGSAMIEFNNNRLEKAVEGFRAVADNHRNTPQGAMSAQMLGSIFLNMGRYDDAIKWFEMVSPAKKELGFLGGEALEGLAGCYEGKGDITRAISCLEKALQNDQVKYRHPSIRWKMVLLNQKLNNTVRAISLCREIISDTTAADYRQQAENMLAALSVSG